ncbi:hypothetical protein SKA34_12145 [Photobacterium sp. SKA34]|nr:hypothetical protein SKA34_12145 [Photobacterium sp. SKA34]
MSVYAPARLRVGLFGRPAFPLRFVLPAGLPLRAPALLPLLGRLLPFVSLRLPVPAGLLLAVGLPLAEGLPFTVGFPLRAVELRFPSLRISG